MSVKNSIYLIALVSLGVSGALIVFLIYPALRDIKNGANEIMAYQDKTASFDAESKELKAFKETYEARKLNLEKISRMFVAVQEPIDFIRFIEKISYDSGVATEINTLPTAQEKGQESAEVTPFQVYAKGNFTGITQFAEKLESGPYLVRITHITMKKVAQDVEKNTNHQVDSTFSIEVK